MSTVMDRFLCWKIVRWDLRLRDIFFRFIIYCVLLGVHCTSNNSILTTAESPTSNITSTTTPTAESPTSNITSTTTTSTHTPPEPMTLLSITSSLLAIIIMITICIWILAHIKKRNRDHHMTWSPPPINVHLHGLENHSLSRTPSHYRSHRTMSEFDQEQPPTENKSGGHTYNMINNCGPGQAKDNAGLLLADGKSADDDNGKKPKEIPGKMSDPFAMIPNPLYRTTSCVMEKRGPMPLPPMGHRSGSKAPRKGFQQQRSSPGEDMSELSVTKAQSTSGSQPDSHVHSVRSKSCDPLRYIDEPLSEKKTADRQHWSPLDSLDTLANLGGLDTPPLDDVFGEPDYSLIENMSGRSRSYSLFHLPSKRSFDPRQNPPSAVLSRRSRPSESCSKGLNGSISSTSERYEMVQNPLCQSVSYNLLDRPEKVRARELETGGSSLKSRRADENLSQRDINDEGYQTISDAGTEKQCGVDKEYTDLK